MTLETSSASVTQVRRPRMRALGKILSLATAIFALGAAGPRAQVSPAVQAPKAPQGPVAAPVAPAISAVVPAVQRPAPAAAPAKAVFQGAQGLSPKVLAMALDSMACAQSRGVAGKDDLLTVIDYSLPSTQPRLWVLDLAKGKVLYHELVAHGSGTGDNYATRFSNVADSRQTSLGLFLTGGTYVGGNGYSLKLQGLDKGFNDRAEARHIVMHGAWYVSPEHARRQGRIGRSWGCPALSEKIAPEVIDTVKGGSFVFSYGPDSTWMRTASSSTRNACAAPGAPPAPIATALAATVR